MILEFFTAIDDFLLNVFLGVNFNAVIGLFLLLGLCFGSFLNVVIYRSPLVACKKEYDYIQENYNLTVGEGLTPKNLNSKKSFCPTCDTEIPWFYNVPVIGWVVLGGKSKCCSTRISAKYPITELLMGALWASVTFFVGELSSLLVFTLIAVTVGYVISVIDFNLRIVLDQHSVLFVISLIFALFCKTGDSAFIINAIFTTAVIYSTVKSYEFLRNAVMKTDLEMMGSGDWVLWFTLCAGAFAFSLSSGDNGIQTFLLTILMFVGFGFLTVLATILDEGIRTGQVSKPMEIPAAPALVAISLVYLIMTVLDLTIY